jgi:hypothetical protein
MVNGGASEVPESTALKLERAFLSALAGEGLAPDGISLASSLLRSGEIPVAIRATGVLLCAGNITQQRDAAARIEELLRSGGLTKPENRFDLLTSLLQARKRITFTDAVRDFVIDASKAQEPEMRGNATVLLAEFAHLDRRAVERLVALRSDSDSSVQQNAATLLMRIGPAT